MLVFDDEGMREGDFASIRSRLRKIFGSAVFMQRLSGASVNWLNEPPRKVVAKILAFLDSM